MPKYIALSRRNKLLSGLTLLLVCVVWYVYPGSDPDSGLQILQIQSRSPSRRDLAVILNHFIRDSGKNFGFLGDNVDKLFPVFEQLDNDTLVVKQTIVSFLAQPIINDHAFTYLHNPHRACAGRDLDILFVIPSSPDNFEKRSILRTGNYGEYVRNVDNKAKLLFFIGKPSTMEIQNKIDTESNTYDDIVQESFDDIYKNIRYKAVSMLKWASTFCQQTSYVIRNDDDIQVDLSAVVKAVKRSHSKYANFVLGRVRLNDVPCRNASAKAYLSKEDYPDAHLPPFALGGLLGYPILTVELLYQAALRVKPIWLDDVFITGMCAPKVGAKLLSDSAMLFTHNGKIAE
ncbi:beta-1,3-galactosyltransferase 1-like [Biomphalaria glabrata]|uniref:Hexosyltransferase n=1 Tax=Biomphalaria glabrata TaxID=6526 RepID=A0A9W2ZD86_BIOGL|nr:beta-1,3-galactosyltransferase 1-like [Biomphalaria glabrata]XP_055872927.1 beta-1,3-galactosyltransferase 1-like [Biomphalaria glabrata]XP_055872928.1 beta-1,3-galactosyltransferase 1-like [Biomphalaria glabrata]XP_055872929.1 beta-1,3-galactosyltransferase 1-like [Biomphalaria glabrata]XP_055872930.1 beta-1,3-galactosyltransferase 1-like [Biomphalaria glabrata]